MEILIDMHNHTIASGHAYSTLQEVAKEASNKGLKYIGITDHGPAMPGASHIFNINNLRVLPENIYGVEVLKGVEANILNIQGEIDVPESVLLNLDIILAGFHEGPIKPGTMEENTEAILNVINNEYVDILVHLGNPRFPIDMETVALAAKKKNKLIELNNSSFTTSRVGSEDNCYELAKICKEHKVPMILNSDSHFAFHVGRFDEILELVNDLNIPKELIVNSTIERFEDYMRSRGKKRFV